MRRDRAFGQGGGVCLYIRNDIAFNIREDLILENTESLWINVLLPQTKPIILGALYRPPKNHTFIETLSDTFDNLSKDDEVVILGDMNICLLQKSPLSKRYENILNLNGMRQLIHRPTRTTHTTSSLIDHVISSKEENISQSGVIDLGISDHSLTYCTRRLIRPVFGQHRTITIRRMKKYNVDDFNLNLSQADWSKITECKEVNSAWTNFKKTFLSIVNVSAPLKHVRIKQRTENG